MATKRAAKSTEATKTGPDVAENVLFVPMNKITADYDWNVRRSVGEEATGGPEESHQLKELIESLQAGGQEEAIILRPKGERYLVVTGFRRYSAFSAVYKKKELIKGVPDGHIKAIVREMTEAEARALNVTENTARSQLNPPDLAYGIGQMGLPVAQGGQNMSDRAIAAQIGVQNSYVSKLHKIYDALTKIPFEANGKKATAFEHWRDRPVANVPALYDIVRLPPEQHAERYAKMFAEGGDDNEKDRKTAAVVKQAERIGWLLGKLASEELVTLETENFGEVLTAVLTGLKGSIPAKAKKAAEEAYSKALEGDPEPETNGAKPAATTDRRRQGHKGKVTTRKTRTSERPPAN